MYIFSFIRMTLAVYWHSKDVKKEIFENSMEMNIIWCQLRIFFWKCNNHGKFIVIMTILRGYRNVADRTRLSHYEKIYKKSFFLSFNGSSNCCLPKSNTGSKIEEYRATWPCSTKLVQKGFEYRCVLIEYDFFLK